MAHSDAVRNIEAHQEPFRGRRDHGLLVDGKRLDSHGGE